jgi:hypothetical protein
MGLTIAGRHLRAGRAAAILCAALCSLAVAAVATSRTQAAGVVLAPLANVAQRLSAYDGYVIFSEYQPTAKDWRLMDWHDGAVKPLAVAPRDMPFDADAGPDAGGAPTVVFSRCKQDPPASRNELAGSQYVREPDWASARGCRIYQLALPNGSPRLVQGLYARGASDSTPAIWRDEIAFARIAAGSHVARVYLWQRSPRRLVRVGGGQPPCRGGASRCVRQNAEPPSAWVDGMSLDGRLLSYEWSTSTATFGEAPFPELRADPLHGTRQSAPSQVIQERFASGTCGYSEGISPNAVSNSVLYTSIQGDCGAAGGGPEEIRSSFQTYSTSTRTWREAEGGTGLVAAIAADRAGVYWISDVPKAESPLQEQARCTRGYVACFEPVFQYAQDCAPAHGTCSLMRSEGLDFGAGEVRHPGSLG